MFSTGRRQTRGGSSRRGAAAQGGAGAGAGASFGGGVADAQAAVRARQRGTGSRVDDGFISDRQRQKYQDVLTLLTSAGFHRASDQKLKPFQKVREM